MNPILSPYGIQVHKFMGRNYGYQCVFPLGGYGERDCRLRERGQQPATVTFRLPLLIQLLTSSCLLQPALRTPFSSVAAAEDSIHCIAKHAHAVCMKCVCSACAVRVLRDGVCGVCGCGCVYISHIRVRACLCHVPVVWCARACIAWRVEGKDKRAGQ